MKTVKTLTALAAVVLSGLTAFALESYNGVQYSTSSTEINPGEWNDQFTFVKAKAEAEGCPLVVFWGNGGCGWCKRLEHAFADKKFTDWQKGAGSGMGAGILFAFDVSEILKHFPAVELQELVQLFFPVCHVHGAVVFCLQFRIV